MADVKQEKMATRQAYGKALVEIGAENPTLVVMDADLSKSTMTAEFAKVYPKRFFDMGIAEQKLRCDRMWNRAFRQSSMCKHFRYVCSRQSF